MIDWLIHIVIDSLVLLVAARFFPKVELKGYKTALVVALMIGILSFFLSWILTVILNLATLGIFYFLGLGFVTRIIAYAIIIELADKMSKDFNTRGFAPSLWLAILLAVVGGIVDAIILT
ncbi:phage holin family protein [Salinimicrobium flavum]|uniref:Phage holin family protein n=1 Tax=Salinimicrobium flavum TaxID=1737065 RepID=A0ABW5IYY0_9FLAO